MGSNILHKKGNIFLFFEMHMYWILLMDVDFDFERL